MDLNQIQKCFCLPRSLAGLGVGSHQRSVDMQQPGFLQ